VSPRVAPASEGGGPRLWVDAQAVQSPHFERGIPRYVTALTLALGARGTDLAGVGLNPSQPLPAEPHRGLLDLPATTWATAASFRAAVGAGPLTYLQASPFEGFRPVQNLWPPFVLAAGVPLVSVVYDTIPFHDPEYRVTPEERSFHAVRGELVRQSDLVLAISEATARDAVTDLGIDPARVVAIGSGVSGAFGPGDDPALDAAVLAAALPGVRAPFVFSVCGWMDRKNTDGLLTAWSLVPAELRSRYQLVITCSLRADVQARWERLIDDLGVRGSVVLTGAVRDDVLLALYRTAELFVYPSRYEGFGLPIAEAVECGTAAISSDTSSMPEVVGWEPGLFPPDDPAAIAALTTRALTDTAYQTDLDAACAAARGRHTWDAVAGRLLTAVGSLGGGRSLRRRVALVAAAGSPLLDLVPALAGSCEVDCFVSGPARPVEGARVFPVRAFGPALEPAAYDERVYGLATSAGDVAVLDAALAHPGIVCLATASLAGLYAHRALARAEPATAMRAELRSIYGERIPERARHGDPLDVAALTYVGAHCTAAIARASRAVVVPDERSARIVELDAGALAARPAVHAGPLAEVVPRLLGLP
jgi:glycosyltransferase involved in cell wall biosynthesis